jgi:ribosome-binding factor A
MIESKRQKQIAGVINEAMNDIFRHLGLNIMQGGMVSISSVKVTPDLLEARIYISIFNIEDKEAVFAKVVDKQWEIKKQLTLVIKSQLRRMPELKYFMDDTLDYVFKMEELFKTINKENPESNTDNN